MGTPTSSWFSYSCTLLHREHGYPPTRIEGTVHLLASGLFTPVPCYTGSLATHLPGYQVLYTYQLLLLLLLFPATQGARLPTYQDIRYCTPTRFWPSPWSCNLLHREPGYPPTRIPGNVQCTTPAATCLHVPKPIIPRPDTTQLLEICVKYEVTMDQKRRIL
jgi:hypothetical protein